MNMQVRNGFITEMTVGSNLTYILNDNAIFFPTEYKVLQSQLGSCLVKCMKMLYNGKIQLFYCTGGYRPLSSMLSSLDSGRMMAVMTHLLGDIIDVKNNGFLACENIDLSFEHIYVDTTTYKVYLVYLPVNLRSVNGYMNFENELRSSLHTQISGIPSLSSPWTTQFLADLLDGSLSLDGLYSRMKAGKTTDRPASRPTERASGTVRLIAMNASVPFELTAEGDEFVIGKSQVQANGVIPFNKAISRKHCKIIRSENRFMICDLESSNGTFVNRQRLQPNQPYAIQHGDIVRLANSDFKVEIR